MKDEENTMIIIIESSSFFLILYIGFKGSIHWIRMKTYLQPRINLQSFMDVIYMTQSKIVVDTKKNEKANDHNNNKFEKEKWWIIIKK